MLYLLLGMIVTAAALIAVLWVGTYFFQGYIYTEPSEGLYWQAPAAGVMLAAGFTVWCLTDALWKGTTPTNIPVNVLHKFSPKEDMFPPDKPAPKLWVVKVLRKKGEPDKDGETVEYKLTKLNQREIQYKDTTLVPRPYSNSSGDVGALEIEDKEGTKKRFDLVKFDTKSRVESNENRRFRSSDGWVLVETITGPTGNPERFDYLRLFLNIFFNLAHLAGWFLALCLLLRFQWAHALGLAIVFWLIFTIVVVPLMLEYAAEVAVKRQTVTAGWHARLTC